MTRSTRLVALGAVLCLAGFVGRAASAADTATLAVDQGTSTVSYKITHKLHTSVGVSKKVEGAAKILPDGTVQVMVRAPVASFDSGNSGRDEHMQETMEAEKFPNVAFKGIAKLALSGVSDAAYWPTSYPTTANIVVQGELDFHGRKKTESFPVTVTFTSPTQAHVVAHFNVSLDKYEVQRPSLLLMKIDDDCQVTLDLNLNKR